MNEKNILQGKEKYLPEIVLTQRGDICYNLELPFMYGKLPRYALFSCAFTKNRLHIRASGQVVRAHTGSEPF